MLKITANKGEVNMEIDGMLLDIMGEFTTILDAMVNTASKKT